MVLLRQPIPLILLAGVRSVSREEGKQGEGTGSRQGVHSGQEVIRWASRAWDMVLLSVRLEANPARGKDGVCAGRLGRSDTLEKLWLGV